MIASVLAPQRPPLDVGDRTSTAAAHLLFEELALLSSIPVTAAAE